LKNNYLKTLIIFYLAIYFCNILACNTAISAPLNSEKADDSFNVRITREEFAEFHDTLEIEYENKNIEMDKFNLGSINYSTGSLEYDEIFSVKSPKFAPDIATRLQNEKEKSASQNQITTPEEPEGIYSVKISGSKVAKRNSEPDNRAELNLFSESKQNQYMNKLKEAASLIKTDRNSEQAQQILSELENTTDNNATMLLNIAKLYIKSRNNDKACHVLEKAEKLDPNNYKILYTYAICLYKQDKLADAEKKLKEIAVFNPDFMYAHYNLGNIYYKKQEYHNAINSFKKALNLDPDNADIYFNIGLTLEMLNYKEMAKKFYSKCLDINPTDTEALKALKKLE